MAMRLTSTAFVDGGPIPAKYTCEGDDAFPPLAIDGAPPGAKSLALIVDDPDAPDPAAPQRTWVHAVIVGLPLATTFLPDGMTAATLPAGAAFGENDWHKRAWGGPCPPIGSHRYFFKLYALDADVRAATKPELVKAMEGHVIAEAQLMGRYEKRGG